MTSLVEVRAQLQAALGTNYELERELGRGGMAVVYLCDDLKHRRKVAVKVLHKEFGVAFGAERFLREIEVTAGLQHPHILPIFDSGAADGQLYYVMPYVEGESLRQRLDREGRLQIDDAARLTRQIAEALDCAHERGVVHRDVKPENVLLSRGQALVADFGIARVSRKGLEAPAGGMLTVTGYTVGTPTYMSPEQAVGDQEIDGRSDEYSLACVVYEMLTGSTPFSGSSSEQVAQRFTSDPPKASARRPELPSGTDAVLARALALRPDERFATAGAFAHALEDAVRGNDVRAEAAAVSRGWRARFSRSRALRTGFVLAVVLALTLLGWWQVMSGGGSAGGRLAVPSLDGASRVTGSAPDLARSGLSVAVLPFLNIGGDTATEYFADGMTEELIGALSKVRELRVPGRASVFALKGKVVDARSIGDTLGVATVLEGSVRRAGGRLRIAVQLVSTANNEVLWSETYDRELRDVFRVQDEISRAIVSALRIKLQPADQANTTLVRAPTEDLQAHDVYLRGRFLWNQRTYQSLRAAERSFQEAIRRDARYAQAHAGLADTYLVLPFFGPVPSGEAYGKAKRAAERALALDSTLVEARTSLGYARMLGDFDWPGAEIEFRRAITLDPNYANAHHWYAVYLWAVNRRQEAVVEAERARALDPLSRIIGADVGDALVFAGRYDDAVRQLRATAELDPNFAYTYSSLCWVHLLQRRPREAVAACERAAALSGRNVGLGYLTMAYMAAGDRIKAEAVLQEMRERARREYVSPWSMALAHLGVGDTTATFEWLNRAVSERDPYLTAEGANNPLWFPLRADPRFARIRSRMRLPP